MSRVTLHIGTHKTGTTFIQHSLAANRDLLARHGVIYPEISRVAGHHCLLTHWHDMPPQYHTDTPALELWQGLARFAEGDRSVILSSEVFSRAAPPRVNFGEVRQLLAAFDEIRVVCVLRDQLSLLQSLFLEVNRQNNVDFHKMMQMALEDGRAVGVFMDYGKLRSHLLKHFMPDEIHFVDYAQARKRPGGLNSQPLAFRVAEKTWVGQILANLTLDSRNMWFFPREKVCTRPRIFFRQHWNAGYPSRASGLTSTFAAIRSAISSRTRLTRI